MSQALRELVVSIDFNDIDISRILQMDRAIDSVESNVRNLGGDLDRMGNRADEAGDEGRRALDRLGRGADGAGDAMDELGRDADRAGGRVGDAANDATDELRDLGNQGDRTGDRIGDAANDATDELRDMGNAGDRAGDRIGGGADEATRDLRDMGNAGDRAADEIRDAAGGAEDALRDMGDAADEAGQQGAGGSGKLLDVINEIVPAGKGAGMASLLFSNPWTAAAAAVVFAIGGVALAIAGMVNQADADFDRMQAKLGFVDSQMEGMKDTAMGVYAQGFGEDLGTVAMDVATVKQAFKDLDDGAIEKLTSGAYMLQDVFGPEVKETSKAIKTMTANFKNLSEQDAMDLVTTGFQKGGDYADDFIDTINEYSGYFDKLGVNAEQFVGTLIRGGEAGAFNLDKVGDSFKEIGIRAMDGSDATKEAFGALGFDGTKMGADFAQGGDKAHQALMATVAALSFVDDAQEQNRIGVSLFGTQWEDMRKEVIFAMDGAEEAVDGFQGATDRATETLQDNVGSKWTQVTRGFKTGIIDAFDGGGGAMTGLLDKVLEIMPQFMDNLTGAIEWVTGLFDGNKDSIGGYIDGISGFFSGFWSLVEGIFFVLGPFITASIEGPLNLIWTIAGTVLGAVGDIFSLFGNLLKGNWSEAWEDVKNLFNGVLNGLIETGGALLDSLFGIWDSTIGRIWEAVTGIDLTQAGRDMIDGLIGGVMDMKDMAIDKVKDLAKGMWSGFTDFFGIKSPSRLMMEGGAFVVQGLEVGIDKTAQDAITAATNMSGGVASAITDTPEIAGIMSGREDTGVVPAASVVSQAAVGGVQASQTAPAQGVTISMPVTVNVPEGTSREDAETIGAMVQQKVNETLQAIFAQLGISYA